MKIRLIAILLVLFGLTISIHGQEISFNIPGNEAYALSKSLTKRLADTSRIDLLLRLAEFHLFKDGEHKANIDSAIFLARDASVLNAKLQNHNRNGHVLLVQAIMARKARDTIEAKQRLVKAIASLRNEKQNFHLAMAFVENLHYFNLKQPEAIRNFFDTINRISLQLQQIKQTDLQEYTAKAMMNFYQKNLWNTGDSIKLAFLNRFLSLSIKLKNKQGEFWARKDIADTHFQQGKVAIALDELQILLQEQHAGDFTGICFTTDLLAGIHIYNSNYDKALLYSLETIKNVRTHLDSFYLCNFYNRISNCYSMLSKDHEALTWSMKAYQTKVSTGRLRGYLIHVIE